MYKKYHNFNNYYQPWTSPPLWPDCQGLIKLSDPPRQNEEDEDWNEEATKIGREGQRKQEEGGRKISEEEDKDNQMSEDDKDQANKDNKY